MNCVPDPECKACKGFGKPMVFLSEKGKVVEVGIVRCTDKILCPCVVAEPKKS